MLAAICFAWVDPALAQRDDGPGAAIVVVGNSPLPGTDIDADKLASAVQTLTDAQLSHNRASDGIANLAAGQLASVSLNDEQGSPFQPDFTYRGFAASPIAGIAEGLAVYQDGVRLNEAFGDNVNWDLIPEFAVRRFTVQSNNPVFGLNALGGAVTLAMKDGRSDPGLTMELSGGSFGHVAGHGAYGVRLGDFALYLAIGGVHDSGFRQHSPATLRQAYGDLAYDRGKLSLHLSGSAARNDIAAVGPTPVQLLARDPTAVFTYPQSIRNSSQMLQLRGTYQATAHLTISADAYYRGFNQQLIDGNTTDVQACVNDPGQFCLEGAGQYPGDALFSASGSPVATSVLPVGATPGEIDHTHTHSSSYGSALQVGSTTPLGRLANNLVVGVAADGGVTRYTAAGELGTLQDDLAVTGAGVIIDQLLSPTAQPPIEAPVDVSARNTYLGIYAIDVLDLTRRLSLTLSGRWNDAHIDLTDHAGGGLDGGHGYAGFNPGAGLALKLNARLTGWLGYAQANRVPTAGELSCANPASPCLIDAFLVSDPPLKQVVAHNWEAGLRGRFAGPGPDTKVTWSISAYRNDADDDIQLAASNINGFGYFRNAGTTRRQGVDVSLGYRAHRLTINAGYSWLDATFRNTQVLASNSPSADAAGLITVVAGDHLPLTPAHRLTLSMDDDLTSAWTLGADLRWQSGQYLVGDASNQQPQLPGFATLDLRTSYRLGRHWQLLGEIGNLFGARYYTYGTFTALNGLPGSLNLTNPRSYSPSPGRSVTATVRAEL